MNMTRMNIERLRMGFPLRVATLAILSMVISVSACRRGETKSPSGQRAESLVFPCGNGWGYQILVNGKVLIHQPTIPAIDTVMAFPDEESARKISTLVLNKWTERQNLSVTKEEVQHSLSN